MAAHGQATSSAPPRSQLGLHHLHTCLPTMAGSQSSTHQPPFRRSTGSSGHRRGAAPCELAGDASSQTEHRNRAPGTRGPFPTRAGRSWPPARQNLFGLPPAGARGLHCKVQSLSEGLSENRGLFCKDSKLLRGPVQKCNFYIISKLLELVKSVENRRKLRNLKHNFARFLVRSTAFFVILT
jgi:hypothetical protein